MDRDSRQPSRHNLDNTLADFGHSLHVREAQRHLEQGHINLQLTGDMRDIQSLYAYDRAAEQLNGPQADTLREQVRDKIDHALNHSPLRHDMRPNYLEYSPHDGSQTLRGRHEITLGEHTYVVVPPHGGRRIYTPEEFAEAFTLAEEYA